MRRLCAATLALIVSNISVAPRSPVSAQPPPRASAYSRGEVIVKLKRAADQLGQLEMITNSNETLARIDKQAPEPLIRPIYSGPISQILSSRGLDRTFVLKFDPDVDIEQIIEQLEATGAVEYAQPNSLVTLGSFIPDDPKFAQQWALRNLGIGVTGFPSTLDADIKATEAWSVTTGNPDLIVAVTDTGVDINHPDLAPNVYTNTQEIPGNGRDDDNNGYADDVHGYNVADSNGDVSDVVGHGTQMAGIIAARTNNRAGISGLTQSKILPVRFFKRLGPGPNDFSATLADSARALIYSIAAGATIINASWRSSLGTSEEQAGVLADAVAATADAGVLLVGIAGNDGLNIDGTRIYPAAYQTENMIVVAASEYNDEIWHPPFDPDRIKSSYGPNSVDLAAPGMAIFTTTARGPCMICSASEDPDDWYDHIDGTSASAAYVSGVAALVKSHYPDDYVTIIKRRILEGVDVRESLRRFVRTSGRLNAYRALTVEVTITPPELTRLKYKAGSGKLFLYGERIQQGATALVGTQRFKAKFKGGDQSRVLARVPGDVLPAGSSVQIRLLNPDGGLSQTLTFTR
jgi:subtilisin family serine protease